MEQIMLYKQNPLNNSWLCYIPNTPQAYYYPSKKVAKSFCDRVNKAFADGRLKFDEQGKVTEVKK
jgi:hypothetical protein